MRSFSFAPSPPAPRSAMLASAGAAWIVAGKGNQRPCHGGRLNFIRLVQVRQEGLFSGRQGASIWAGTEKALGEVSSPEGPFIRKPVVAAIPASPVLPQGIPRSGEQDATPLSREVSRRFSVS